MEREYTIGAILVLVAIFVIVLIVYFTVPGFNDSIGQIADEVFGLSKKVIEQQKEEVQRKNAVGAFKSVVDCIEACKGREQACTCYLKDKDLPEGYIIKTIPKEEGGPNLILEKDNLRVKGTDEKPLEGLNFCILKDLNTPEPIKGFVIESEDGSLVLKYGRDEYKFVTNAPEFYNFVKDNQKYICFVTNDKEAKQIREINDCKEPEKNIAKDKMLEFFNSFVEKYKHCKTYKDKHHCMCDEIDFKKRLWEGYDISVIQEGKTTTFTLHYAEDKVPRPIGDSKKVDNNLFGFNDVNLGERTFLKEWQTKKASYTPYIFKLQNEKVHLYSIIAKPEELVGCAPEFVVDKDCKAIEDREIDEMLRRLRGENPDYSCQGVPCKRVIEETIEDPYLRLLVASIIPGESGFKEDAVSENIRDGRVVSIDKGIMQFNDNTAPQYGVCHAKGCKYEDFDRRGDPSVAIPAAARLMSDNLKMFEGKTYQEVLAIAAYNAGASRIKQAIEKSGKNDPTWNDIRDYVPDVTKCYPYRVETYKKAFRSELSKAS